MEGVLKVGVHRQTRTTVLLLVGRMILVLVGGNDDDDDDDYDDDDDDALPSWGSSKVRGSSDPYDSSRVHGAR